MIIHRKTIAHSFKKDKRRYYVPISSPKYISSTVEGILTDTSSTSTARGVAVEDLVAWKLKIDAVRYATEYANTHIKKTNNKHAKYYIKAGVDMPPMTLVTEECLPRLGERLNFNAATSAQS